MAKRAPKKEKAEKVELLEIGSAAISDVKERWSDGDSVLFDCVLFKSIQLHGMTGRFNDQDEFWVSFPARKGSDGKYYKHYYGTFTDEALEMLEKTLFSE